MPGIGYVVSKVAENHLKIQVQIQPNAKRDEITGFDNNTLKIKIAAPPIKGKANKALIDFLSKVFEIRKSRIAIEKGETARRKIILLGGIDQGHFQERVNQWMNH